MCTFKKKIIYTVLRPVINIKLSMNQQISKINVMKNRAIQKNFVIVQMDILATIAILILYSLKLIKR